MGKVINFPQQPEQTRVFRERAFAAFAAGNYTLAAEQFEEYFTAAENNNEHIDSASIIQFGQSYLELKQIPDAVDIAADYLDQLSDGEAGREFILRVGMAAPDFTLITLALQAADGEPEFDRMRKRADEFEAQYVSDNRQKIEDGVKQLAHMGGATLVDQERLINDLLPQLPVKQTTVAIKRALVDPDLLPVMRTALATWLQRQKIDEEMNVFVFDGIYQFNPKMIKAPFADPTAIKILNALGEQTGGMQEMQEMMFVRISMLYPVIGQIIQRPEEFVTQTLNPDAKTKYAHLQQWMDEQLMIMGNLVNK
ncbi:hypothetical protein [Lacticaseibacillus hulanensis]|uniref:hypothetical protein n=1 Tax=Lacticaseibacillus hulanensis TaxID=2493111 RepID=UPI000FD8A977|nr:hypothetical protein [Lacticaseibacillus hulanensis]